VNNHEIDYKIYGDDMQWLFFATLRGPGTVWIQSLPFSRLAAESLQLHQTVVEEKMKAAAQEVFLICSMAINFIKRKGHIDCALFLLDRISPKVIR
jgi:hypothetical protein